MATQCITSRRPFVGLILCFLVCLVNPIARTVHGEDKGGLSQEKLKGVTTLLNNAHDKKQIPGGAALVFRRGHTHTSTVGYRDIEGKALLQPDTLFRIASMSKPITSVAVMMLVEDGKLKVDDSLSKFVPEFKDMKVLVPAKDGKTYVTVKAAREITVHDLLTHSSGITYRLLNKPFVGKMYVDAGICDGLAETDSTLGDNVRKLARLPLVCQPGSAWEYGLNTDVLGHIIEVVSGKSLEEFFRERIFKPLEMNDTYFVLPKEKRTRLAALYMVGADKKLERVGDKPVVLDTVVVSATYPTRDGSKYYSGGAGLVSTIEDYGRFGQMLLNRGELNQVRILKGETVDRMTRNQLGEVRIQFPGNDLMGYGFGILSEMGKEVTKDPSGVGSYGWGGAFGTFFWVDPKNELVGVYMGQTFPPDFTLSTEFKKIVYESLINDKK